MSEKTALIQPHMKHSITMPLIVCLSTDTQ